MRNHNSDVLARFGRDKGADIPTPTDYTNALKPLLDRFGNEAGLTIVLFTLDEASYSRELAPLAGHYPALRLGPAWWFHDSPEGMRRYLETVIETAGFYNTAGFNDDTRDVVACRDRAEGARVVVEPGCVLQHSRVQRRHARPLLDPGTPRRRASHRLRVPGATRRGTPAGRGRGPRACRGSYLSTRQADL
jgi:glucuronate isomerase